MTGKSYRLFISHSWAYADAYERLVQFLRSEGLSYYDHSIPRHDPIHTNGTDKQLREAIDAKIKGTSCIIILAGVYATYSKWIKEEIKIAQSYAKPIIGVEHWGAMRTSSAVKASATRIVKWQAKSIVNAIIELG